MTSPAPEGRRIALSLKSIHARARFHLSRILQFLKMVRNWFELLAKFKVILGLHVHRFTDDPSKPSICDTGIQDGIQIDTNEPNNTVRSQDCFRVPQVRLHKHVSPKERFQNPPIAGIHNFTETAIPSDRGHLNDDCGTSSLAPFCRSVNATPATFGVYGIAPDAMRRDLFENLATVNHVSHKGAG